MFDSIYLEFLDTEVSDLGTCTDGAVLGCQLHGEIHHFSYNEFVPAMFIVKLIEDHRKLMHFG